MAFQTPIERDISKYRALGIHSRKEWGSARQDLVTFEDLIRYYNEVSPELVQASEEEIRQCIY